ncbi:MAG: nucleotidyl transferase AbiEii/AbiGii toxin family protein [Gammaproteobacteria bacterium]|nr:nucleotidyl transferase AbiEii/AbiGii toxin family protein [Gammaproteobacteria bacterium]
MNQEYVDAVRLLLAVAPAVFRSPHFALKGGTALNLFLQDMPRLSVDIDVAFTDHTLGREDAQRTIASDLRAVKSEIARLGFRTTLPTTKGGDEIKLFVSGTRLQVKVEVNLVFRGTVLPVTQRPLTSAAQELFTTDVTLPDLDPSELYGSKLVAAMDRQHPRDMFDVSRMLDRFGWQSSVVDCFVAYLAGHNRPIHEVLFPNRLPLEAAFANEFKGLTNDDVALTLLEQTQERLMAQLPRNLTSIHRDFLLSLVRAEPAWDLMPFANLQHLPPLQWKLLNLRRLKTRDAGRFAAQEHELAARFKDL